MRKRYRWDRKLEKMVPINEAAAGGVLIMPDIPDFVSPVDGKVVHGRKGLREHNKRHGVTNVADFKNEWAQQAKERARLYSGDPTYDSKRRKEHLIQAFDKLSRRS